MDISLNISFFNNSLYKACKHNNTKEAINILNNTPNKQLIEYIGKKGKTPLLIACENKLSEIALCIIRKYGTTCNFNVKSPSGDTAFSIACEHDLFEISKEMIKYFPMHCDLEKQIINTTIDKHLLKITPLMYFGYKKQDDLFQYVIDNFSFSCGLDKIITNTKSKEQNNKKNTTFVSVLLLLCKNKQINLINYIMNNYFDICEINISKKDVTYEDSRIKVILWFIKNGMTNHIKLIINKKILNHISIEKNVTIFIHLCKKGWFNLAHNILQFIPKLLHSSKNNTLGSNSMYLRKLLITAIDYGLDNTVRDILKKYSSTYKKFNECRYCVSKYDIIENNYCINSHSELTCDKYTNNLDEQYKIQCSTPSILIIMCTKNLINSIKYYMKEYANNFTVSLPIVHHLQTYDTITETNTSYTTSFLMECINVEQFNSIGYDIMNTYPQVCWSYQLDAYGILSYAIDNCMEQFAIILVQSYPELCYLPLIKNNGDTHLISACKKCMENFAIELLKYNDQSSDSVNINYVNKDGFTAFDIAIQNNLESVKLTIQSLVDNTMISLKNELNNAKHSEISMKHQLCKIKEKLAHKEIELENQQNINESNVCFTCGGSEYEPYISINCFHITNLCETCCNKYVEFDNCAICRTPLNLKKCYNS